ncbi:MAG: BREX protein BrxB domain-containing protein [Culicoidibacterales bacterium]
MVIEEQLQQRLQLVESKLTTASFLQHQSLSFLNYVFTYEIEQQPQIDAQIELWEKQDLPIKIVTIHLFELICELYGEDLPKILALEAEGELADRIIGPILDTHQPIEAIQAKIQNADVIFFTGIATAYPFVKSSNLLKRMADVGIEIPVILFYPGTFSGKKLHLFGDTEGLEDEYQIIKLA